MRVETMSIDLAKSFIQVLGVDACQRELFNRRLSAAKLGEFVRLRVPKRVVMEACGTAHHWGRQFQAMGIEVALIAPQLVTPFRVGDKTDANDCWAIFEASRRPNIKYVRVKSQEHQLLQTWLRRRDALIGERTQRVNAVRAYLAENGQIIPRGIHKFHKAALALLSSDAWISDPRWKDVLHQDLLALNGLQKEIGFFDDKISLYAKSNATCVKLQELAGVGPITAVALVAAVVAPSDFKNGRQFAAYLGLVPRQHSSGGKARLLGIAKDGNAYLRMLLIHGGRSLIWSATDKTDDISRWAIKKKEQKGFNKASVAVANKNARIAWATMAKLAA